MTTFDLCVRAACAGYILYKVWRAAHTRRVWDAIFGVRRCETAQLAPAPADVLGSTNIVVLGDPREPVAAIDLAPTGYIGEDTPPEEPEEPSAEDLYDDAAPPDSNEISSGMAFEDLSNAADVLVRGSDDPKRRQRAAQTLCEIQDTQIMDFVVCEVSNAEAVQALLSEHLDGGAKPRAVRDFSMGKYL